MSRWIDANGYARVWNGKRGVYEHRHVWESVHGPIPNGWSVHHRNHQRADNRLENLALVEKRVHDRHHTTKRHATGELNNRGRNSPRYHALNDQQIAGMVASGMSYREIGRQFGVSHNTAANHHRRFLAGEGNECV